MTRRQDFRATNTSMPSSTRWSPTSAAVTAARDLFGNAEVGGDTWAAQHATILAGPWPLLRVAAFLPLAVRRHQRAGD